MKVHIAHDDLGSVVKVWLYRDEPGGRVFMWPVGYEGSSKAMTWYQEIVSSLEALPDTIRPALEMSRPIWDAFKEALLADTHFRVDALDIVAKALEREQSRVDYLMHALVEQAQCLGVHPAVQSLHPAYGTVTMGGGTLSDD